MTIEYRYEFWSKSGKIFTPWLEKCEVSSREEARELISSFPKVTNKLKNEYRIKE